MVITIKNEGNRSWKLDSTLSVEMRTMRPPLPGAVERLEHGDVLMIRTGRDIKITFTDAILSIRGA